MIKGQLYNKNQRSKLPVSSSQTRQIKTLLSILNQDEMAEGKSSIIPKKKVPENQAIKVSIRSPERKKIFEKSFESPLSKSKQRSMKRITIFGNSKGTRNGKGYDQRNRLVSEFLQFDQQAHLEEKDQEAATLLISFGEQDRDSRERQSSFSGILRQTKKEKIVVSKLDHYQSQTNQFPPNSKDSQLHPISMTKNIVLVHEKLTNDKSDRKIIDLSPYIEQQNRSRLKESVLKRSRPAQRDNYQKTSENKRTQKRIFGLRNSTSPPSISVKKMVESEVKEISLLTKPKERIFDSKQKYGSPSKPISISISLHRLPPQEQNLAFSPEEKKFIREISSDIRTLIQKIKRKEGIASTSRKIISNAQSQGVKWAYKRSK